MSLQRSDRKRKVRKQFKSAFASVLFSRAPRRAQRHAFQVEPLEERRLLTAWVAPPTFFIDPAHPGDPQPGDTVTWPTTGQFAQLYGGSVQGIIMGQSGFTSIQAAIAASSNGNEIDVAAGTYNEQLTVSQSVTLLGAFGDVTTTISGNGQNGITVNAGGPVTVRGFTVSGCDNAVFLGDGSTVSLESDVLEKNVNGVGDDSTSENVKLSVTQSSITNNNSGINIAGFAGLTVISSTISGNQQAGIVAARGSNYAMINSDTLTNNGGAGMVLSSSGYSVNDCQITGNGLSGIDASQADLTVADSTISGNNETGVDTGGGIHSERGALAVTHSTIANNAGTAGGGIFSAAGSLSIVDSTIANNSATTSGGGILTEGGPLTLIDSTVAGNSANVGGGVWATNANATIGNTIVAGNTANGSGSADPDVFINGTLTTSDHDLIGIVGDAAGFTDANGSAINGNLVGTAANPVDPMLAVLGDYGGLTQTMVPLAGSPALGMGNPAPTSYTLPSTDQRNVPRTVGGIVDIGATQGPASQIDLVTDPGDGTGNTLRNVIAAANPGDTIEFALPAGTTQINLTQGPVVIDKNLSVQGPGALQLTLNENNPHTVCLFQVNATDVNGNPVAASLSNLTLTQPTTGLSFDSSNQPTAATYPAVYNAGSLLLEGMTFSGDVWQTLYNLGNVALTNCIVSHNNSGIQNYGNLAVSDSILSENRGGSGGGVGSFGNNAVATITRCIITNNSIGGSSSEGGGVYNGGKMTIVDSTISQNYSEASLGGGGIYNQGSLTIQDSTVSGNTTDGAGGNGIYNHFGTLTVTDCTISDNTFAQNSYEAEGGGIKNDQGRLSVFNSTIAGNSAKGTGGGIESDYGALTVVNSTVTGNTASTITGNSTSGSGGGIENLYSFGVIIDSTISGNTAGNKAGGIDSPPSDGSAETFLVNTIVAGNLASGGDPDVQGDFSDSPGAFTGGPSEHDLIGIAGDATGFTTIGTDASLVGTAANPIDPLLGPLADNGGPTQTMALLSGSPAIDAGGNVLPSFANWPINVAPTTDQRGVTRILNGTVDIGAYEFSRVAANASGNYTVKLAPGTSPGQMQREIIGPNNNVVFTSPANATPALIFANTGGYTVSLTVDYSSGDPIPAGGLTYDGGGNDSLTVTGYNSATVTDIYTGAHSGAVEVGTGAAITYMGLSPLALDGTEQNLIVNLPSGAADATLQDDGTVGNGMSQLTSTTGSFETTTFTEPTGSLTVNAGAGGDTITIARSFISDFDANLSLNGGAGDDSFNVYATPANGKLNLEGGGSVNGNVLNDFTPADAEIFSDAGITPVVSIASAGETPLTYTSIQQVNVTPGDGVVNVYGDDNQPATSQNDGYQVIGTGPNAFTLSLSGNNAGQASYSQPISFVGVRTLNVNGETKGTTGAHSDTNQLTITPYADNTPQGWGVQTFWNQGDANGGTLVYNGVAGVSENIVVAPSGAGAGQLVSTNSATSSPIAVVNYSLNTNFVVNGNDGSAGDTDMLTLKGINPGAAGSQQFTADFATPGSSGPSVRISDVANGKTLDTLQGFTHISSLNVTGVGAPSLNTLLIDGYNPANGQSGQLDASLTVGEDRSSSTAGVVSVFQSQPPGIQYPQINYSGIGTLNVNSATGSSVQGPTIAFGSPGVADSGLEGSSDTGIAGHPATLADRITGDSTPTFYGTAQAGALVQLYVDMNGNGKVDNGDVFIGETAATPAAGGQANGQWTITSTVDLNNPKFGFAHDGLRTILAVAQDAAGDSSSPQSLAILLDTQGPQIGGVNITGSPNYHLFLNEEPTPTPLVNSLDVTFTDPVLRDGGFSFPAVNSTLATTAANYQLVGRTNGAVPITSVTFSDNTTAGGTGASIATLHFATPLADDFYTLTISDKILDNAGNSLDGDFNGSSFPSGNGTPGGSFSGSFVVNSHPHLAVANNGSVSLDINGDGAFDPSNTVPDSDFIESFGLPNDQVFSGKFAVPNSSVSGFDELGAYGYDNNQWRWLLNFDPSQGTSNPTTFVEPLAINGQPVAGYFAGNPSLGMQVGLFSRGTWYLDVLNHHTVDSADVAAGGKLKGNMTGTPIVGDFDGDGKIDLATYRNGLFEFDLSSKDAGGTLTGKYNATLNAQALIPALASATATPVAADLDGDGITDLGLFVSGTSASTGQWFWLLSNDRQDAGSVNPSGAFASLNHTFNPAPLGHDLSYQYGDPSGTPLVGVWDPPTSAAGASTSTPIGGFVSSLYETVLGRQPSQTDLTTLNNALAGGQSTSSQVAEMLLDSGERLGTIINGYYEQYLGRAADQAGLNYWISVWRVSGGSELVQAGIIGSPEYFATAGRLYPDLSPEAAWVTALYNNLLGRAPDADGLNYWMNYVQTHSRASVVIDFVTSAEYRSDLLDGWYEQYLGRAIDSAAATYWLAQMEHGVTQQQILSAILSSEEFMSR